MTKKSQRTKDVRKLSILFGVFSVVCFVGVAIFTVIAVFSHVGGSKEQGMEIISQELKTRLVSLSVTTAIVAIAAIFIKEKMRITIYMLALILNGILFKEVGMYIILGIYALDEFVFTSLYKRYKQLTTINKEIDKRE